MELEDIEQRLAEGLIVADQEPPAQGEGMSLRERFQRTMHYQQVDRLPNFEFGYWAETLPRWHAQGLPEWVVDQATAYDYFGIETEHMAPVNAGLNRPWASETIEETEERVVYRDALGALCEVNRHGERSIPRYLEYPVRDWATWREYRRYLEDDAGRYPEDWGELAQRYRQRDYPLGINISSMIGVPRCLIGFERIAMLVYEDPALLEDMVEAFCQCVERTLPRALATVQFDFGMGWEDICFNSGPIVGLAFMRDVVAPRYRRITDLLRLHGVDIALTDCDGDMNCVVPSMLEAGMNCLFPVEVHAGTDPVALRRRHGKSLRFWGGVDKMIFLKDRDAVDRELERLRPVVEDGGFIPTVDHRVQADARYDLYRHYLDRKREWFGVGGEPKY